MFLYVLPSGPLATNTILFASSEGSIGAVIDPAQQSCERIIHVAADKKIDIKKIFLTHSHWDHFADAHALKQATGATLYVHPLDAPNLTQPGIDGIFLFSSITPVSPDYFFEDGTIIDVGSLQVKIMHTPGHSPGSVCLYIQNEHILFSGDTFFRNAVGRTDFSTGNMQQIRLSLKKIAHLPEETQVIPGHGQKTTIRTERDWMLKMT